jgi:23S rRNA (pseudouridine1915-N3)-methyltransferase
VRISLICVGRSRGSPFADDVAHYERLLARHARLETHELREAGADPGRREETLRKEGAALLERLPGDAFVCVLDRHGRQLSSAEFASWVEERRGSRRNLCFVIGGPLGLDRAVLERADEQLSLGAPTLPHQLARVVLLEQLFRAHKILAREPYHY